MVVHLSGHNFAAELWLQKQQGEDSLSFVVSVPTLEEEIVSADKRTPGEAYVFNLPETEDMVLPLGDGVKAQLT